MVEKLISGTVTIRIPKSYLADDQSNEQSEPKTKTKLAKTIERVENRSGILSTELCVLLGTKLGVEKIPLPTLHTWKKGITPRKFSESTILDALSEIEQEHGIDGFTTWVEGKEIAATVTKWEKHLSQKQIAIACNESRQLVNEWVTGHHRVRRKKWNRIVSQVESAIRLVPK